MRKHERIVIAAATLGSVLEWYEVFLFVYWTPIISQLFFNPNTQFPPLLYALLVFAIGLFSRPFGGLLFGYLGDRYGRKLSLLISIIAISLPTFILGFLPTYAEIGFWAPAILCMTRILQGLPSGGELPGAMCYLVENAAPERRRFMGSWSFVGPQLGIVISMTECLLLEKTLAPENLFTWGWRLSFALGGLLGLLGFFLRRKMHESPVFAEEKKKNRVSCRPIYETFAKHKKKLVLGAGFTALDAVGIFVITVFSSIYFEKMLGTTLEQNITFTAIVLTVSTLTLPFFGKLGDRFPPRSLLLGSALGTLLLALPFYYSVQHSSVGFAIFLEILLLIFLNMQFALLPSVLAELFPAPIRYTGMGLSYNICSGLLGGLSPVLALFWVHRTGANGALSVLLAGASLISGIAFLFLAREKNQQR